MRLLLANLVATTTALLISPFFSSSRRPSLFGVSPTFANNDDAAYSMKSKAATQAEGTIIVGGGIAGLAMAVALRNVAGVSNVKVLEKRSEEDFTDITSGAAAQLGPNGLRALNFISSSSSGHIFEKRSSNNDDNDDGTSSDKVDMVQKLLDEGASILKGATIVVSGNRSMSMEDSTQRHNDGYPQLLVRWGVLHALLLNQLPVANDVVLLNSGSNVAGYKRSNTTTSSTSNNNIDDDRVCLIDVEGHPLVVESSSTPLIIGADGIKSTFRALIRKDVTQLTRSDITTDNDVRQEDIKYGKRTNVKAVVNKVMSGEYNTGYTFSSFIINGSLAAFSGPAGEGLTYWAISIADSVNSSGKGGNTSSNDAAADSAAGNDDDATISFIDGLPTGADGKLVKESLKEKTIAKLKELESELFLKEVMELVKATSAKDIFYQKSEEAKELGSHPLHSSDGRVVLVGDAAHAMSASYGQACNFALEDAATLAACIRDSDDLVEALKDYSKKRLDRCIEMQTKSAERANMAMKGEQVEDVTAWIYKWDIA